MGAAEIAALAWTGSEARAFPRFSATQGLNGAAVRSGQTVSVPVVARDPRYLTAFGTTRSEVVVLVRGPERGGGAVRGTIDVESERVSAFGGEDVAFLEACAEALAPLWR